MMGWKMWRKKWFHLFQGNIPPFA